MRYLSIVLLFFIGFQSKAQNRSELINTWVPINVTDYEGEPHPRKSDLMLAILTFYENGKLRVHHSGTNYYRDLDYQLKQDSLTIQIPNKDPIEALLLEGFENRIKVFYDSFNIVTYQPFEASIVNIDQVRLKKQLTSSIWTFKQVNSDYNLEWSIDFRNGIQDSSFIRPEILQYLNDVYFEQTIFSNNSPHIWSINEFKNVTLLRIEEVGFSRFSDLSGIFFIDSYSKNKLRAHTWLDGKKVHFEARAQKKNKNLNSDILANLFRTKWRFESAKRPKIRRRDRRGLMDLGMADDDFLELTEPGYIHDSTLLISSDDLEQQRLIFEFNANGEYGIYREKRLIDYGAWQGFFNNTLVKIESDTNYDSDGVIRGHIEIIHLSKNKLVLKRKFLTILNGSQKDEWSLIETYRPIR